MHEVKAHYREVQKYLRRYRRAWKWLLWAPAVILGVAIVQAITGIHMAEPLYLYILSVFGFLAYYLGYRFRPPYDAIPCPHCRPGYAYTFNDWICGSEGCYHKHTHTNLPTRRTFLEPCKVCKKFPHSIICPDCRQPIIFDDGAFKRDQGSAWFPSFPPVTQKPSENRRPKHIDKRLR